MSWLSAQFFSYVQSADFYRTLHQRAVALLPRGASDTWFDVGCGAGLVTRLAAAQGYRATGFDLDPAMLKQARRNAKNTLPLTCYELANVNELARPLRQAKVVSAASLLTVLDDPQQALQQLLSSLTVDGTLLIIETNESMQPRAAWAWLQQNGCGKRNWILLLWAWTRMNRRSVQPNNMGISSHYQIEQVDVFVGMVSAWLIRRNASY